VFRLYKKLKDRWSLLILVLDGNSLETTLGLGLGLLGGSGEVDGN
jgi:hypothetical protein